jgi:adenosylmethionine-8-amino-7-oxononanoate aminotransferase
VEDRATKAPFGADKKVGQRVLAEMTKRGVITRARVEHIFFAPPLIVSEEQVDRLVSVTRDAIKAVTGV